MFQMTSDTLTNVRKHVTSNTAFVRSQWYKKIQSSDCPIWRCSLWHNAKPSLLSDNVISDGPTNRLLIRQLCFRLRFVPVAVWLFHRWSSRACDSAYARGVYTVYTCILDDRGPRYDPGRTHTPPSANTACMFLWILYIKWTIVLILYA